MSKIVARLLEDVTWLHDVSGILTLFFTLLFIIIVVRVLKWKKEEVNEYKNLPLSDTDPDDI